MNHITSCTGLNVILEQTQLSAVVEPTTHQCEQIWGNSTTLANNYTSLAVFGLFGFGKVFD